MFKIQLHIYEVKIGPVELGTVDWATIASINFSKKRVQRVPALRFFWDLEKTVLHETRVIGTVLWSPTNANSPTYTYISQKTC